MKVFRGGKVHVLSDKCETCIFRPGNLMDLHRGRVKGMVEGAVRNQSCIPCHDTIGIRNHGAICRGFFDLYKECVTPLIVAEQLGYIEFDQPINPRRTYLTMSTKSPKTSKAIELVRNKIDDEQVMLTVEEQAEFLSGLDAEINGRIDALKDEHGIEV